MTTTQLHCKCGEVVIKVSGEDFVTKQLKGSVLLCPKCYAKTQQDDSIFSILMGATGRR